MEVLEAKLDDKKKIQPYSPFNLKKFITSIKRSSTCHSSPTGAYKGFLQRGQLGDYSFPSIDKRQFLHIVCPQLIEIGSCNSDKQTGQLIICDNSIVYLGIQILKKLIFYFFLSKILLYSETNDFRLFLKFQK